jgi:hypothetical protein
METSNGIARSLPTGLIATLAIVLVGENFVTHASSGLISYDTICTRFAAEHARTSAPGCAVLGLGDSMMKYGFDPAQLEERLGSRTYNLAAPGLPTAVSDALLQRAFDAGSRPSIVLLCHLGLGGDPHDRVTQLAEVLSPIECLELGCEYRDLDLTASLMTARLLPSLRYRYGLRALIRSKVFRDRSGSDCPGRGAARAITKSWATNRGAELRLANYQMRTIEQERRRLAPFTIAWGVDTVQVRHLTRLVARANARGASVFWVIPPLPPTTQALRDKLGHDVLDSRNLLAVLETIPGLTILDARRLGCSQSQFFDAVHLNKLGAAYFSTALADAIRVHREVDRTSLARLAPQRWYQLPLVNDAVDRVAGKNTAGVNR